MQATAIFQTTNAAHHLNVLCHHFSKKVEATFTEAAGHVAFPFGTCVLTAESERLTLVAKASDRTELALVIDVVTRHLERFAFRENPNLDWEVLSHPPLQTSSQEDIT